MPNKEPKYYWKRGQYLPSHSFDEDGNYVHPSVKKMTPANAYTDSNRPSGHYYVKGVLGGRRYWDAKKREWRLEKRPDLKYHADPAEAKNPIDQFWRIWNLRATDGDGHMGSIRSPLLPDW